MRPAFIAPEPFFANPWQNRFLPVSAFRRLLPALAKTRLVHLQGWGEPFLHPNFFDLARMVKSAGCLAGATTNGVLLDQAALEKLVGLEFDLLAFSLAGTGDDHDRFRPGAPLETVLKALAELKRIKKAAGSDRPAAHIAYLLTRSGLEGLPRLPELLKELGVAQIMVSTLDFPLTEDLAEEAVIPANEMEFQNLTERLDTVAETAGRLGLGFHYRLQRPRQMRKRCPENIGRAMVIAADAKVAACVFDNLSLAESAPPSSLWSPEGPMPYARRTWGVIEPDTLDEIWAGGAYRDFRKTLGQGRAPDACRLCLKRYLT